MKRVKHGGESVESIEECSASQFSCRPGIVCLGVRQL